ncbi:MAG: hypothetical protein K2L48_00700 [Mycoplasmoidaceae bacterium]|nr:hypothetical protein [Mycoplasmoidaceae bacterium]
MILVISFPDPPNALNVKLTASNAFVSSDWLLPRFTIMCSLYFNDPLVDVLGLTCAVFQ